MKVTRVPAVLAMLTVPLAAPAAAQRVSAADHHDAQCAVVAVTMSKISTATPDQKSAINSFMMYYLGKLMGRHTVIETKAILSGEEKAGAALDVAGTAQQCASEMTTVGTTLQQP